MIHFYNNSNDSISFEKFWGVVHFRALFKSINLFMMIYMRYFTMKRVHTHTPIHTHTRQYGRRNNDYIHTKR